MSVFDWKFSGPFSLLAEVTVNVSSGGTKGLYCEAP